MRIIRPDIARQLAIACNGTHGLIRTCADTDTSAELGPSTGPDFNKPVLFAGITGDGGEWAEIGWAICGSPVQRLPASSYLPFFTFDERTGGRPIFGTRPWLAPSANIIRNSRLSGLIS